MIGKVCCIWDYYDAEFGYTMCHEDYEYDVYEHNENDGTYEVQTVDGWMTISEKEFNKHFEWCEDDEDDED